MLAAKVTPEQLRVHITKMDSGLLNFSDVELNSRADLVRFEGYTVDQAANMDEGDVYRILEGESEDDEWGPNVYGIMCSCGSKAIKLQFINGYPGRYGSSEDGYLCKCECDKEFFVHECAIDAMDDYEDEPA